MLDLRPVIFVCSFFVLGIAALMLVPMLVEIATGEGNWMAFAISSLISGGAGGVMVGSTAMRVETLSIRQGFLITTFGWLCATLAAALPFWLGEPEMRFTQAFFEAMSGLSTTGATVVSGLDQAPAGFLLWRAMLQFFGGIGIIVVAIAVLPLLSIGGMQLFRLESSDRSDKILGSATGIAAAITTVYVVLNIICAFLYWAMGMTAFDAICHALATLAAGGFSTHDASFGYFIEDPRFHPAIDLVATFFMIAASLPFTLFALAFRGNIAPLLRDPQVRLFLGIIAAASLVIFIRILPIYDGNAQTAFRYALFNVTSIASGTGFATTDYQLWGPFAAAVMFCITFCGGCAGSAASGLKMFRLQIAFSAMKLFARRLSHPNVATVERYGGKVVTPAVLQSVLSLIFLFFAAYATIVVIVSAMGLDTITAISGAATTLSNCGPGLGPLIGPAGNFAQIEDGPLWVFSVAMLLGRLEMLTVLVIFTRGFWRA